MSTSKTKGRWDSVRCIFQATDRHAYEERITLWLTESIDAAIREAEVEAAQYGRGGGFVYTGLAQAYDLKSAQITNGSEVFSLIRSSDLEPNDYIDKFFDTGAEFQQRDE